MSSLTLQQDYTFDSIYEIRLPTSRDMSKARPRRNMRMSFTCEMHYNPLYKCHVTEKKPSYSYSHNAASHAKVSYTA